MAERATISQVVQVGKESTSGTSVAAGKKLTGLNITTGSQIDVTKYKSLGQKFLATTALNKEWVQADLSGPITYSEIVYVLAGLIKNVTPTGTTAKTWVFAPSNAAEDTPATFTVEQGSSTRAHKFAYGLVNALNLKFSRNGNELSGTMLGQALTDGITLTSTPTDVELVPVTPTQVQVYLADTAAGLAGASALTRALEVEWNLSNRWGALYPLNASTSWAAHVETEPELQCKLLVEADAAGMGLLTTMRNGATKFMRIKGLGALISGGDYYMLQIDTALRVTAVDPFEDSEGVYAIRWTMEAAYDSTWAKATEITAVNTVAAL